MCYCVEYVFVIKSRLRKRYCNLQQDYAMSITLRALLNSLTAWYAIRPGSRRPWRFS